MRNSFLTPTIAALIACSGPSLRTQEVPATTAASVAPLPTIAYQGRLLDGAAIASGARVFTFSILDVAGVQQWNSGALTLTVEEGLYSVVFGSTGMPPLPTPMLGMSHLKLHVTVSGLALTPDVDIIPAFQAHGAWEVTGAFGGDVTGTQHQMLVMKLQGTALDLITTPPGTGQALVFDGSKWVPGNVAGGSGGTGPAGPKGDTGATGPAGAKGDAGAVGIAGAAGAKGDAGAAGAKGDTGAAGLAGAAGTVMLTGLLAPTVEGVDGQYYLDTVTNTLYGPKATVWPGGVTLVGPKGDLGSAGVKGDIGDTGPQGLKGDAGLAGAKGDAGAAGLAGAKGDTGAAGAAGLAGAKGDTGAAGKDGSSASVGFGTANQVLMTNAAADGTLWSSLPNNLTMDANYNIYAGWASTENLTTGSSNLGIGARTLRNLTEGGFNTALGFRALMSATTGIRNVAVGSYGAIDLTTGSFNTAVGDFAGQGLTTGTHGVFLGRASGTPLDASGTPTVAGTLDNQIAIGWGALATKANQMVLGGDGTYNIINQETPSALAEVIPGKTDVTSLGSTTNRWSTVYAKDLNVSGDLVVKTLTVDGKALGSGGGVTSVGVADQGGLATSELANGAITGIGTLSIAVGGVTGSMLAKGAVDLGSTTVTGVLKKANGGTGLTLPGLVDQVLVLGPSDGRYWGSGAASLTVLNDGKSLSNTMGGKGVLSSVTTASGNAGFGENALANVTIGNLNTAVGYEAMRDSTGTNNSVLGALAGAGMTAAAENVAIGYQAAMAFRKSKNNVAIGSGAMSVSRSVDGYGEPTQMGNGWGNVGVGYQSMYSASGNHNTGIGYRALAADLGTFGSLITNYPFTGFYNVALGSGAGSYVGSGNKSVFIGVGANTTTASQSDANAVGGTATDNQIAIGFGAIATKSNQMVLGGADDPTTYNSALTAYPALTEVIPGRTATATLGSTSNRWSTVYAGNVDVTGAFKVNGVAIGGGSGGSGTVTSVTAGSGLSSGASVTTTTPTLSIADAGVTSTMLAVSAVALATTTVTGKLPVAKGGTGQATGGTKGQVLVSDGNDASPLVWANVGDLLNYTTPYSGVNTRAGVGALPDSLYADGNTAFGFNTLHKGGSQTFNTAVGNNALAITTAGHNTAIGNSAGATQTTGWYGLFLGSNADGAVGDLNNQIAIGSYAKAFKANQMVLGADGSQPGPPALVEVVPGKDGATNLGTTNLRWLDVNSINIHATTSVFADSVLLTSDGRLKTNQQPITNGLATLMTLRPKTYFKHQSRFLNGALVLENEGTEEAGFIAQELHETLPTAAHRPADETKEVWTVSYDQVIPYTVKAVQELKAENDALSAKLTSLQAELAEIKALLKR